MAPLLYLELVGPSGHYEYKNNSSSHIYDSRLEIICSLELDFLLEANISFLDSPRDKHQPIEPSAADRHGCCSFIAVSL